MVNKKSQAAMEFLSTYGWALIVVLVAIGVLFHFGVLDLTKMLPKKCTSTTGLECMGLAQITGAANTVEVVVKNNLGVPIAIQDQNVSGIPVMVGSEGDCAAYFSPVAGPDGVVGTADDGNINLSHAKDTPPEAVDYAVEESIPPNDWIRIKIKCPNTLVEGDRFSDQLVIPYKNTITGLDHTATVFIQGQVD